MVQLFFGIYQDMDTYKVKLTILSSSNPQKKRKCRFLLYVLMILLSSNHTEEMIRIKDKLAKEFKANDLGKLEYFFGMKFTRSKNEISVS